MYRFAIPDLLRSWYKSPPPTAAKTLTLVPKLLPALAWSQQQHFFSTTTTPPPPILNTDHLLVNLKPTHQDPSVFHFVWLRDNCPCPKCIHASTRQKLHTSGDIPTDIQPISATWVRRLRRHPQPDQQDHDDLDWVLEIEWPTFPFVSRYSQQHNDRGGSTTPHVSQYTISYLHKYDYSTPTQSCRMDPVRVPWCGTDVYEHMHIDYQSLPPVEELVQDSIDGGGGPNSKNTVATMTERTRHMPFPAQKSLPLAVLERLATHGLVFMHHVPTDRGDDYIETVAKRFGHGLRNTFYGSSWDVKSDPKSSNIAYTNLPIGLHMDLMYFESPPGIQFLHMLQTNVSGGGMSVFVDMLHAWQLFVNRHPEDLSSVLMQVRTSFHYAHPDNATSPHYLKYRHPMVNETRMYYSPPFQSPEMGVCGNKVKKWYEAMRAWELHLQTVPKLVVELREGDVVVFSNRRVLHGRTGFNEDGRRRHLRGCYVDEDELMDRVRVMSSHVTESRD